jgi:hypothetical protein
LLLKAIEVADTAPRVSVLPCTTAHLPTDSAADVVLTVFVNVVFDVTRTVPRDEVDVPDAAGRALIVTVIVEPDTAVTFPATTPPKPRPPKLPPPLGAVGIPVGLALGGVRVSPPAKPHVPFVAALMCTVVAVIEVAGVDEDVAADTATMQLPTVTPDRAVDCSTVNLVFDE